MDQTKRTPNRQRNSIETINCAIKRRNACYGDKKTEIKLKTSQDFPSCAVLSLSTLSATKKSGFFCGQRDFVQKFGVGELLDKSETVPEKKYVYNPVAQQTHLASFGGKGKPKTVGKRC